MQALAYLYDKTTGEKLLCLVRQGSYGRYLKLRKSGKDGIHLTDEEIFINQKDEVDRLKRLKNGERVFC
jgi:hypothetical protein